MRNDADGKSYLYDVINIQRESSAIAADGFAEPTIYSRAPSDESRIAQDSGGVKSKYSLKDMGGAFDIEALRQLAQEMSTSPPPREIPQRPVQQSPQEILSRLAREMTQDPTQGGALADLSNEDLADILSSIAPEGKGASQDIEGTSPGTSVEIRTVDFSDKASVMEQLALAQKETAELDHEVCYTVTADGKVWKVSGEAGAVNPAAIPSSLAGSYSFHNHPRAKTRFSFSPADVRSFFNLGEQFAKAADYLYEYTMERTEDTVDIDPDVVYNKFRELLRKAVFRMKWNGEIDPDTDEFHAAMKILSRELNFKYERKKTR